MGPQRDVDRRNRGARLAGYLEYHGLAASAPRGKPKGSVPAKTVITVYNGAETDLPATIAYLEKRVRREGQDRDRPGHPGRRRDHASGARHPSWSRRRRPEPAAAYSIGVSQCWYAGRRPRTASK